MRTFRIVAWTLLGSVGAAAPCRAQAVNIDLAGGIGVLPSDAYGAAAGQPGRWSEGSLTGTIGLDGLPTSISFGSGGSAVKINIANAIGDDKSMMETAMLFSESDSNIIRMTDVQPGWYNVFVYAWGGNLGWNHSLRVGTFNGDGMSGEFSTVTYTTQWPGQQVYGVTYVALSIQVLPEFGLLGVSLSSPPVQGFNAVNGIQIVPIPAPGALATLAIAPLLRRRRRPAC